MRLPFPLLTKELSDLLGLKLVAYIARIRETRTVREWAEGVRVKRGDVEPRLRVASGSRSSSQNTTAPT